MSDKVFSKLLEVIEKFDTAMLVTHDDGGQLRARPLSVAQSDEDGTLWFFTARESGKVLEIDADARVNVVFQSGKTYASVTGHAAVVEDREQVKKLWRESFRPWFPGGKDDPSAVAVRVEPLAAEYWDTTGMKGLSHAYDALKAVVRGERMSDDPDDQESHERLEPGELSSERRDKAERAAQHSW